jgi:hypothetical protein
MLYHLRHSASPFLCWGFWDRILWTICSGWLWMTIFRISASWVARITGRSHLHPVSLSPLSTAHGGCPLCSSQRNLLAGVQVSCWLPSILMFVGWFLGEWAGWGCSGEWVLPLSFPLCVNGISFYNFLREGVRQYCGGELGSWCLLGRHSTTWVTLPALQMAFPTKSHVQITQWVDGHKRGFTCVAFHCFRHMFPFMFGIYQPLFRTQELG